MDDVLIALGDAYEAEARIVRAQKQLPEEAKQRLEKIYDQRAADAYRKVATEHSASQHVEDARDRLAAMNLPIPTPTQEQAATSAALENSRGQYRLQDRAKLMILRRPDVVMAAHSGEPPLTDAKPTLAPAVSSQIVQDYKNSMNPNAAAAVAPATQPAETAPAGSTPAAPAATAAATPAAPATPLQLQEIPNAEAGSSGAAVVTNVPGAASTAAPAPTGGADSMGVEVLTPGGNGQAPATTQPAPDPNGGLKAVGPTNTTTPPPVEKPAAAPDAVNDVVPGAQAPGQAPPTTANGKKAPKPAYDKDDESSSKHKKKKGLAKINPF
jgi:outer membrane protein assembly factor BamD